MVTASPCKIVIYMVELLHNVKSRGEKCEAD